MDTNESAIVTPAKVGDIRFNRVAEQMEQCREEIEQAEALTENDVVRVGES